MESERTMQLHFLLLLLLFIRWNVLAQREDLLEYVNKVGPVKYLFRYKTNSGVTREEVGEMMNAGTADQNYVVKGRTVNFFPDGSLQIVEYVADKYGYRPKITFLTTHQLQKLYLGGDQSSRPQPVPGVPDTVPQGFSTQSSSKTEDTAKPNLTESNVGSVEQNLIRLPPRHKVSMTSTISKTSIPFSNEVNSPQSLDDEDDVHNRIGANTAAALLGHVG